MSAVEEQPPPIPTKNRAIWEIVVEEMQERDQVGRERYGVPLTIGNGRDALVDAYQEALDQVVYLRKEIAERRTAPSEVGERWVDPVGVSYLVDWISYTPSTKLREIALVEEDPLPKRLDDPMRVNVILAVGAPLEGWTYRPHPVPHRLALVAEVARLRARERELLANAKDLVDQKRGIDRAAMVRTFMRSAADGPVPEARLGQTVALAPRIPPEAVIRFRARLAGEEFCETFEAIFVESKVEPWHLENLRKEVRWVVDHCVVAIDMVGLADGSVDTDYVVEGLRGSFGLPSDALWAEVQRANVDKLREPRTYRASDGKLLKPEGWKPPDIRGVLVSAGWKPMPEGVREIPE